MIEFKDEEEYCRYNGILCTPENMTEMFGGAIDSITVIEGHCVIYECLDEDFVIWVDTDSLQKAIELFIKTQCREEISYSYSNAFDEAHGFSEEHKSTRLIVNEDFFDCLRNIKLLGEQKKKTFKIKEFLDFQKELDEYYSDIYLNNKHNG